MKPLKLNYRYVDIKTSLIKYRSFYWRTVGRERYIDCVKFDLISTLWKTIDSFLSFNSLLIALKLSTLELGSISVYCYGIMSILKDGN